MTSWPVLGGARGSNLFPPPPQSPFPYLKSATALHFCLLQIKQLSPFSSVLTGHCFQSSDHFCCQVTRPGAVLALRNPKLHLEVSGTASTELRSFSPPQICLACHGWHLRTQPNVAPTQPQKVKILGVRTSRKMPLLHADTSRAACTSRFVSCPH